MSLRRKTLLIVAATLAALLIALYGTSQGIVLRSFARLEERQVREDVQRAKNALDDELAGLAATARDWAAWDDTYAFIQDGNREYQESNLLDKTFETLRLHALILVDAEGRVVFGQGYDLAAGAKTRLPAELAAGSPTLARLAHHPDPQSRLAGLVHTSAGPMLVASEPILTSDGSGPVRGALIMGRYLDAAEVARLMASTRLTLAVHPPDDLNLPPPGDGGAQPAVRPVDAETVLGYAWLRDVSGNPLLALEVREQRHTYAQGQAATSYFMLAALVIGLVLGGVVLQLLLEKLVLARLERLSDAVAGIRTGGDLSARVSERGRDELAALGSAINAMLARLQASQQESERARAELYSLTSNLPGVAYRAANDEQWTIEFVSQGCEALTGYRADELVGGRAVSYRALIVPEDRERALSRIREALNSKAPYALEYRIRHRDGRILWVWERGQAIPDAQGNPSALAGFMWDVTERKDAERLLRQQSLAMQTATEGMAILDATERYVYVNEAHARLYGYTSPGELVGQSWRVLYAPAELERFEQEIMPAFRHSGHWAGEAVGLRRDGSTFPQEVSLTAIPDGGLVCVVRDISERKRLEERLHRSQKLEAIGRLAGGVAHDFNNLLTAINGYASFARDSLPEGDPAREDIGQVLRAAGRATDLTRQLLAFSRRQIIDPQAVNLNELVLNLERMLRRLISESIEFEIVPAPNLWTVRVDAGQMEQVLMNLVVNASDAMPEGGRLTIETANVRLDGAYAQEHVSVVPGDYVMLAVSDTGCGMSEEVKVHLFEPFFTTKDLGKGTGLGLATCYGVVKQNGGNIWCYSELGRGTTFKIYLPAIREEPRSLVGGEEEEELPTGTQTVLLVEDEEAVRSFTARVLRGLGYRVSAVSNGDEALALAEGPGARPVDLLLTDVVMPRMGGEELARRLKAIHPRLKVLYISGYTANGIVRQGILEDNLAFLQKPFSRAALARKVREALERA